MKIKTNLLVLFLSILCLFAIANAEIGFGISDVGTISSITSIEDETTMPAKYFLNQNYPNPFNPITTINFSLAKSSLVKLEVYNSLGQKVATLVNTFKPAGNHEAKLDATHLASGIYLYKIRAGAFSQVRKMVVMK
jgi:hypothetical protein